uniref:amyloid-beta A4 precursor protein-binding family B member 3-like isoform X3 n=1 Tax=Oncorhynchus gorbuscha TaxID=8017 RepID=UPI001EAF5260|nr:amyloid-beta A4 precursor protein-binding family B member 3-like isoform X3 [Oncorhynchus gorbuscha]
MLGKDYMLAIIIVNYDDNIWNDPSLDLDTDLPSGWRTIRDSTGTYYWHVPTGTTQWQHPSYSNEEDQSAVNGVTATDLKSLEAGGRRGSRARLTESPVASVNDRISWQDDYFCTNMDPDSKGQDMMMVLKKDTLSLMDPVDRSLIHCQPIINIRVWGVGCNNGRDRDFAFVASDKETCMLKCHVFRCNAPAKTIATALHEMCSKIMAEKTTRSPSMARSLTMENISPEDLPRQVDFLDAMRKRVQKFEVQYIGNLPVSRAMGMEVLNRAIESIMNTSDSDEWEPIVIHISDTVLSLWKGEDGDDPFWECQVRYLTFLGVGHDTHTFAVIVDCGTQRFECHIFWCEPDAGIISEAVQAACMVQYQKCLVAQTPPPRSKMWQAGSKVKRANSMDGFTFPAPLHQGLSPPMTGSSTAKKGMLAFFETFINKQSAVSTP